MSLRRKPTKQASKQKQKKGIYIYILRAFSLPQTLYISVYLFALIFFLSFGFFSFLFFVHIQVFLHIPCSSSFSSSWYLYIFCALIFYTHLPVKFNISIPRNLHIQMSVYSGSVCFSLSLSSSIYSQCVHLFKFISICIFREIEKIPLDFSNCISSTGEKNTRVLPHIKDSTSHFDTCCLWNRTTLLYTGEFSFLLVSSSSLFAVSCACRVAHIFL